jgi:hypothetical protein
MWSGLCLHILLCQRLSFLLLSYYCEAIKIFAKYYNVAKGTMLLFCIFVCVYIHENVVNLKTIEGADYVKSSWYNSMSDTVFADAGNVCCLTSKKDTFYCTWLIVCSLKIMFQCDHPFLSFDTHIYIYIYSSDYIYHFPQKQNVHYHLMVLLLCIMHCM